MKIGDNAYYITNQIDPADFAGSCERNEHARQAEMGDTYYPVMIEGENGALRCVGHYVTSTHPKLDDLRAIAAHGHTSNLVVYGSDWSVEYHKRQHEVYRRWEHRMPVWEWVDGKVCDDRDALADCLC